MDWDGNYMKKILVLPFIPHELSLQSLTPRLFPRYPYYKRCFLTATYRVLIFMFLNKRNFQKRWESSASRHWLLFDGFVSSILELAVNFAVSENRFSPFVFRLSSSLRSLIKTPIILLARMRFLIAILHQDSLRPCHEHRTTTSFWASLVAYQLSYTMLNMITDHRFVCNLWVRSQNWIQ